MSGKDLPLLPPLEPAMPSIHASRQAALQSSSCSKEGMNEVTLWVWYLFFGLDIPPLTVSNMKQGSSTALSVYF